LLDAGWLLLGTDVVGTLLDGLLVEGRELMGTLLEGLDEGEELLGMDEVGRLLDGQAVGIRLLGEQVTGTPDGKLDVGNELVG